MSHHPTSFEGSVHEAIAQAIEARLPGALVDVVGGGGHFTIEVTSAEFAGKTMLDSHRLVLGAIAHLMSGDGAPVHAVDRLTTKTP